MSSKTLEDRVAALEKEAKKKGKKRRKKAETTTLIHVLLDRSGSMGSAWQNTIEGFNKFKRDQEEQPGKALLSLTQFDDRYEPNYEPRPIAEAPNLDMESYQPRGMTALNDAIAKSIGDVEAAVAKMAKAPDQVLFVIFTDGMENASTEYPHVGNPDLLRLIERKNTQDAWQFAYLGANQDAARVATTTGGVAMAGAAATYHSTPQGTSSSWSTLSGSTSGYRAAGTATTNQFFDSDQVPEAEDDENDGEKEEEKNE